MKIAHLTLVIGLGSALVLPLAAQQADSSQQSAPSLNSVATPSPTASPNEARHQEHKKHQRRHRGKRRQARTRDENREMTRQRRQNRERQQNGAGTEQDRAQVPASTATAPLDERTAPENVAPQPVVAPQPTPQ